MNDHWPTVTTQVTWAHVVPEPEIRWDTLCQGPRIEKTTKRVAAVLYKTSDIIVRAVHELSVLVGRKKPRHDFVTIQPTTAQLFLASPQRGCETMV